ncbi:hypothetical protein [Encephalitozoon cuniculi GB-M1]|uniref:SKI-interacting protein SKIP SNW domain-containing protein n=2 Tax=Encephalitozoon cuniculi TaxID=6035 RepID=Q8SW67_ENCCU|nr:uncharacterized protein ECU03_0260 [Encephalitozoon cuniculi GB-M1]KMV66389.1 hypothetical protein M970_030170 [Encephalitozoon cuniculi EcunIII-L]UYI28015.1 hypothetical protein J0A71_09g19090 [Encephalitozoon cuniculi]CAD26172.2 hypothetical protein [Encephalitozoon cuniculi GB-M1]
MGVKKIENGKYGRVVEASPDPLRITYKRGAKQSRKEAAVDKSHKKAFGSKTKIKLSKCVSMWKNPTSQIVSLEARIAHDRFKTIHPEINIRSFEELKSSLDSAEHLYFQDNRKAGIKEEKMGGIKGLGKHQPPK